MQKLEGELEQILDQRILQKWPKEVLVQTMDQKVLQKLPMVTLELTTDLSHHWFLRKLLSDLELKLLVQMWKMPLEELAQTMDQRSH